MRIRGSGHSGQFHSRSAAPAQLVLRACVFSLGVIATAVPCLAQVGGLVSDLKVREPPKRPPLPTPPVVNPLLKRQLESFRLKSEDYRSSLEADRAAGVLTTEEYRQGVLQYHSDISFYRESIAQ